MASFDWTFCFKLFVLLQAGCRAMSWSRVELSTCEVPMSDSQLSLCCHTSNIPDGASIFFYAKQAGTTEKFRSYLGIKPPCLPVPVSVNSVYMEFTVNDTQCIREGVGTVYEVTLSLTYSEATGNQWACGFYGNFSDLTISPNQVLTTYHGNILYDIGDNATLNWTLNGPVTHPTTVDVYGPSGGQLIHAEDRNVTYHTGGLTLTGDVLSGNIGLKFDEDLPQLNGTYVCVYNATGGFTVRDGVTLVFIGEPKTPTLKASQPEATSTKDVVSGRIDCVTSSQSAAPLYYKPELKYKWRMPSTWDDPNFSGVTTGNNSIRIPGINCLSVTSLPVYCQATEGSHTSYHSAPMNLTTFCTKTSETSSKEHNPVITALVTVLFIIGFFFTTTVSVVLVVGRQFIKRKLRRYCRRSISCCRSCGHGSDSDSDSDMETALHQSIEDEAEARQARRERRRLDIPNLLRDGIEGNNPVSLNDGLARTQEDIDVQDAIERFAIEESLQAANDMGNNPSFGSGGAVNEGLDRELEFMSELEGAVGGVPDLPAPRPVPQSDPSGDWESVERLLQQHNKHLNGNVLQIEVDRSNIVHHVLQLYDDPQLATSRVAIKMTGELGMDCGGVMEDMFTTFWYKVQESYFLGYEMVVPFLPINRWDIEEHYYRTFGRILSHTVAVTKALPLPLCKSALIVMIFDTTNVDKKAILEDFLFFLDPIDRQLVTTGMNNFKALTEEQIEEMQSIFTRFDYPAVIKETTFNDHLTKLARNTICIRPKPLLDLMREGIPQPHFQHFWSMLNISYLEVLFRALRPTATRVIARLKTDPAESDLSQRQRRAFRFLQDFLKDISQPEIETFLHFLTGSKSTPRQAIIICFNKDVGFHRAPKAHTCSNLLELPETYEDYSTFKSEFKHLLAAAETMTMSMA